ncbi:NTF2-like N-terminal transpeptidase domain-containing protein [Natrinema sp. H-ect4]|jgi:ketosteroid isomerase-like protein|uniref:NTF2-like N-terminal transpeptidase domain-containing protein n=1 Tax=Natrinema sp. H-ect4 TaxID=3242699 RepID=UPI0035A829E3
MQRRQFLGATAVATAGLAGCMGVLNDSPDEVVEKFYQAANDGDRATVNDLLHSDSPSGEISEEEMSNLEDTEMTVEETEVVDETDSIAEVRAEITMEQDGESTTNEMTIELRTEDGDWKIYE